MKIKNYTIFDSNVTKNWNLLRESSNHNSYFIPNSKKEFLEILNKWEPPKDVLNDFENLKKSFLLKKVISLGSGRCNLEYHLMSKFNLLCDVSDNTDSIKRINSFEIFNNAFYLDIKRDFKLNDLDNSIVLLSRIDTELEDFELKNLFLTLNKNNVKLIYFIPAEILNLKTVLIKIKIILFRLLQFKSPVSWGYIRNLKGFNDLWKNHYQILSKNKNLIILVSNDTL